VEDILNWRTLVFTLAVFIFSLFLRRTLEALFPSLSPKTPLTRAQRVWEEVVLPSTPVLMGIILAVVVKSWLFPPSIVTPGSRAVYGAVCGFFSTWGYRIIKAVVSQKFAVDLDKPMSMNPELPGDKKPVPPAGG